MYWLNVTAAVRANRNNFHTFPLPPLPMPSSPSGPRGQRAQERRGGRTVSPMHADFDLDLGFQSEHFTEPNGQMS